MKILFYYDEIGILFLLFNVLLYFEENYYFNLLIRFDFLDLGNLVNI